MAHSYMVSTVSNFFNQLDGMKNNLQAFSLNVENRRQSILNALDQFQKQSRELKGSSIVPVKEMNLVQQATNKAITDIDLAIKNWNEQKTRRAKGAEFMKKHQKYLVVMIFGAVKTGKSSLGNFIAGHSFNAAPFDNAFKHHPAPKYETEESGRENGGIVKDEEGRQKFAVGYTDTTGAVQYFTLSGLRWMDSPGTGAVALETDSTNMEELVNEYIPNTDFCLFLQNSSEPGLQSDMKYIKKLTREGQEAIIVITKSDHTEVDIDEAGNIVQKKLAKTADVRKKQEDSVLQQLHETYPEIDGHKYRILSISTELADLAVKTDDDELFKDSHVDILMKWMGEKFANEAGQLKEERVRKNVNVFIDDLMDAEDGKSGILQIQKYLEDILSERNHYISTLEARKDRICRTIQRNIHHDVSKQAHDWDDVVSRTGKSIDSDTAGRTISGIVEKYISAALNKEVAEIIDHFENRENLKFVADLDVGSIGKHTKTIEKEYKRREVVARDPSGAWEHIRSFFGKTYYRVKYVNVKKQINIDMGSNIEDYLDKLFPLLDQSVVQYVSEAIAGIEQDYFAPQQRYVEGMTKAVSALQRSLEKAKFN